MRRHPFPAVVSALLIIMGGVGPAQADNGPHVSNAVRGGFNQIVGADRCILCHRVHTTGTAFVLSVGPDGLCLTCHGPGATGATTDVVGGVGYGSGGTQNRDGSVAPGALRAGGFDYALIDSGAPTKETYFCGSTLLARNQVIPVLDAPQATTSKHGVIGVAATAGDSAVTSKAGASVTLECGSCHNPHGNGNYRVLRPIPMDSGGSTAPVGVAIPDASAKVYTTTNYWLSGDAAVPVVVNGTKGVIAAPDGYVGNVTRWCITCHQRNHVETTVNMTGTTCVTCHVAHGSNARMSGADPSPVTQPDGSVVPCSGRLLRVDTGFGICLMCHTR